MQHENRCTYDFDGVLHPTVSPLGDPSTNSLVGTGLFGWVPALVSLLRPHSDVKLVVHSTWRYMHDVDELRAVLGDLGARVVGATPRGPRYESILWWFSLSPSYVDYRILDDDASEFPVPLPPQLVLCNPATGVAAPEVLAVLEQWLDATKDDA